MYPNSTLVCVLYGENVTAYITLDKSGIMINIFVFLHQKERVHEAKMCNIRLFFSKEKPFQQKRTRFPAGTQRWNNVDSTSWRWINVVSTLCARWVNIGIPSTMGLLPKCCQYGEWEKSISFKNSSPLNEKGGTYFLVRVIYLGSVSIYLNQVIYITLRKHAYTNI